MQIGKISSLYGLNYTSKTNQTNAIKQDTSNLPSADNFSPQSHMISFNGRIRNRLSSTPKKNNPTINSDPAEQQRDMVYNARYGALLGKSETIKVFAEINARPPHNLIKTTVTTDKETGEVVSVLNSSYGERISFTKDEHGRIIQEVFRGKDKGGECVDTTLSNLGRLVPGTHRYGTLIEESETTEIYEKYVGFLPCGMSKTTITRDETGKVVSVSSDFFGERISFTKDSNGMVVQEVFRGKDIFGDRVDTIFDKTGEVIEQNPVLEDEALDDNGFGKFMGNIKVLDFHNRHSDDKVDVAMYTKTVTTLGEEFEVRTFVKDGRWYFKEAVAPEKPTPIGVGEYYRLGQDAYDKKYNDNKS